MTIEGIENICVVSVTSTYDDVRRARAAGEYARLRLTPTTAASISATKRRVFVGAALSQPAGPVSQLLVALTGTGYSPLIGNDVTHPLSVSCCCCCCSELAPHCVALSAMQASLLVRWW